ncbi:DUF3221 domain-containing protein [Fredinandcohnia sp. 179-A 10B2 NHS]|uniref:DUF3221 domain-containing protein n=1 Tax=Fredinandcohnia sp. 179-A 10B2 NHS TaxID=3235176 RepID=UPI0039A0ECFD
MKRYLLLFSFLLLFIGGCGNETPSIDTEEMDITGYLIEVGDELLLNEKIDKEQFNTKTEQEIIDEYYLSSIRINLQEIESSIIKKFEVGQKVKVTVIGGIAESAPAQAKAKKIEIIED